MIKKIFNKKWLSFAVFCILSFVAGGINGFVGTGGGIIFVYMLEILTDNEKRDSLAVSLCATVPISLIALFTYFKNGNVDTELAKSIVLPCILGGVVGAFLTDRIKAKYLNCLFAVLVIYSGAKMLLGV